MFKAPNKYRYTAQYSPLGTDNSAGNNGMFHIPHYRIHNYTFIVMCSDGLDWEHISISVAPDRKQPSRCPTWEEMCWIKDQFWSKDTCTIQYHPSESEYVNVHPYTLHIWRPTKLEVPTPNKKMVG